MIKQKEKPLVLILCGGQSMRLWPLSEYKSKNFLDVFGFSPLEVTIKRYLRITSKEKIFLIANIKERQQLNKIKLIPPKNIFYEPQSKNTAAAVLLSILKLQKFSDRPLIITPVDNLVKKEKFFYKALDKALAEAKKGFICTLGIKPSEPTPNFGYIQTEGKGSKDVMAIKRFMEKPSQAEAARLIKKGNCYYNSGMFVVKIGTLLGEFEKYYPQYRKFVNLVRENKTALLYKDIDNKPFDKVIMEKTKEAKVVKGEFFWKDFGSWHTIYELLAKDNAGNAVKGAAFIQKGKNNLIYLDEPDKKLIVMGLDDVFFIDTKGFTLLASRSHINNLKQTLQECK